MLRHHVTLVLGLWNLTNAARFTFRPSHASEWLSVNSLKSDVHELGKKMQETSRAPVVTSSIPMHVMYSTTRDNYSYVGLLASVLSLVRSLSAPQNLIVHFILPEEDLALADNMTSWFNFNNNDTTRLGRPRPSFVFHRLLPVRFNIQSNGVGQDRLAGNAPTFARWYAADFYMPNVSRVLWIDTDTIVRSDIEVLFQMDLDSPVAITRQPSDFVSPWKVVHDDMNHAYFRHMPEDSPLFEEQWIRELSNHSLLNAGVMMMNLDRWRSENILGQLEALAEKVLGSGQGVDDQLVLNLLLQGPKGSYKELDSGWNTVNLGYDWLYPCGKHMLNDPKWFRAKILHWSGPTKPWSATNGSLRDCTPFELHAPSDPKAFAELFGSR